MSVSSVLRLLVRGHAARRSERSRAARDRSDRRAACPRTRSRNTLDTLITENGRSYIRHYLQDVGSTFGMCNDLYEWDLSYEHFFQADTTRRRLFSFGFRLSPWQTVPY